jgi:hypothetical protein
VATYLTIPEITEAEYIQSLTAGSDGVSFTTVIALGDTAMRLKRAADQGEHIPLVVIATDGPTYALDSVYVSGFVMPAAGPDLPVVEVTFLAQAVRVS